jgi:hypothetical protein
LDVKLKLPISQPFIAIPLQNKNLQKIHWTCSLRELVCNKLIIRGTWLSGQKIIIIRLVKSNSFFVGPSHKSPIANGWHPPKCVHNNIFLWFWHQKFGYWGGVCHRQECKFKQIFSKLKGASYYGRHLSGQKISACDWWRAKVCLLGLHFGGQRPPKCLHDNTFCEFWL